MRAYILRRLAQSVLVVWAVTTIMFFMFRVMPADPTAILLERGLTDEARQALLERWGLTGSLWDQYIAYLGNLLQGDFGASFFYRKPVWEVLFPLIVNTLWIAVPGLLLGAAIGLSDAAARQDLNGRCRLKTMATASLGSPKGGLRAS